jgi:hypothetical protein
MKKVKVHTGCIGQEDVAIGLSKPPAPKCRCKKMIDYDKANDLVKTGQASWVIVKLTPVETEAPCRLCATMSGVEKKTCAACSGKGKTTELREIPTFNNDIVLLSEVAKNVLGEPEDRKKYRRNTREKTPRVATVETKHIYKAFILLAKNPQAFRDFAAKLRFQWMLEEAAHNVSARSVLQSYVFEDNYAAARIEDYGQMSQIVLQDFGAELKDGRTGEVVVPGRPEPVDERKSYPPGSITFSDGTKNKTWWHTAEGRRFDYGRAL